MFPKPIEKTSKLTQVTYQLSLPIVMLIWLIPLFAVALISIRSSIDLNQGNYWGMPTEISFIENYHYVIFESNIGRYILNSFRITLPSVLFVVLISALSGFALAIYKIRFGVLIFFLFVAGNFVPAQILMIPVRELTIDLDLYNTKLGLMILHIAMQVGFCTLFMRNFIKTLPDELFEAARVEGVSEFKIFWFIVIPLMKPAISALSVLVFTFVWNDYFWAMVLTQSPDTQPITAGITSLKGEWVSAWNLISAGSIIAALPPVFIFFIMQKQFIQGLTLGSVK